MAENPFPDPLRGRPLPSLDFVKPVGHEGAHFALRFDGTPADPELDPEVQRLAKVIAAVLHPSYRQTEHVFHRRSLDIAVAVLKAGYHHD